MANSIEGWFAERPRWLQTLVALRLSNGKLAEEDYEYLTDLCRKEAGDSTVTAEFRSIPPGSIDEPRESRPLRLKAITSITGVNALKPDKPLEFGDSPLAIVYGDNGSGKSGYTRLLKHVSGSPFAGDLHGDAFDATPVEQKATLLVTSNDKEHAIEWTKAGGPAAGLRRIHVFDSDSAANYLERAIEPAYEPFVVRLFAVLIQDCDRVQGQLSRHKRTFPPRLPMFPDALRNGARDVWYSHLSVFTPRARVDENCSYSADERAEAAALERELHPQQPGESAADLRRRRAGIAQLTLDLQALQVGLSAAMGGKIRELRQQARVKRADATTAAQALFGAAPLPGVGGDVWRRLWDAAREYSQQVVYPGRDFPVVAEEARCVLCQQPVDGAPAKRLLDFEGFVTDALEGAATSAERLLSQCLERVPDVPDREGLKGRFEAAGSLVTDVDQLHQALVATRKWVTEPTPEPAPPDVVADALEEMRALDEGYQQRIPVLEALGRNEDRTQKQARLRDLKAKEWLAQQRQSVEAEIDRLKIIGQIDAASDLTNTQVLTRKKNDLSQELLADQHEARFMNELRVLGGERLPIKVQHYRADKAQKPGFGITLRDSKRGLGVTQVLSEGEKRLVALASFLADVTAGPANVPFVFDDPISSLDQEFEEATVRRLLTETKARQVVVFTHRISLVSSLCALADESDMGATLLALRRGPEGKGTPGETFIRENNPVRALNKLLNERLPQALRARTEANDGLLEALTKALCSDLRILVERLIETVLLNSVIERFRRNMMTKGKLQKLAQINSSDCAFLDQMMTAYSFEEHSQPSESPRNLPALNIIEGDLKKLVAWAGEFQKRT